VCSIFTLLCPARALVSHVHGTRHFWETSGDSNPIIIQNRRPLGRNHYTSLLEMAKGCWLEWSKRWGGCAGGVVEFAKLSVLINIYIYNIYIHYTQYIHQTTPPFSIRSRSPERRTINHFIIVINDLGVAGCFHTIKPEQRLNSYTLGCLRPFYTLILAQLSFPRPACLLFLILILLRRRYIYLLLFFFLCIYYIHHTLIVF